MREPRVAPPKRDGKAFFDRRFIAPARAILPEVLESEYRLTIRLPPVSRPAVLNLIHPSALACYHYSMYRSSYAAPYLSAPLSGILPFLRLLQ
jgi:hypothetical protein